MITMLTPTNYRQSSKHPPRRGAAIVVCIFVVLVMSIMVVSALKMQTSRMASVRNTTGYDQALYLAGAAAHHALAELEADTSWRDGLTNVEFPAGSGNTYSVTISDDPPTGVTIDATGTADGITRKLQLSVSVGG
jgi:type II secretory pathway component PulK